MIDLRRFALPLVTLIGIGMIAWGGLQPDYWLMRSLPEGVVPPYPAKEVLGSACGALLQCAILAMILRTHSYRRSWGRALCAALLALFVAYGGVLGAMHAPPYYGLYLLWWLGVTLGLILLSLYSAGAAWRHRRAD
ncbi:hypothetical protein [Pseudomonas sp. LRF_L74]|uniref:hypothetical protein n=1 Tax=Pseudomonas sp. LRF_L74 TaxID=3369422 RepID=UPI003F61D116